MSADQQQTGAARKTMRAAVVTSTGSAAVSDNFQVRDDVPRPEPGPGQVLVRVRATALNPVDWKMAQFNILMPPSLPGVLGCDLAGVVEAVGPGAGGRLAVGDEVWGYPGLANGHHGRGTFAQYAAVDADLLCRRPAAVSAEEAATLGVGAGTAALVLRAAGAPLPAGVQGVADGEAEAAAAAGDAVLVWGASSSVGAYTVQLAALAGLTVIGVAGDSNLEYVRSLGARHALSYRSAAGSVVDDIAAAARADGARLRWAINCVSPATGDQCVAALVAAGSPEAAVFSVAGDPAGEAPPHVRVGSVNYGVVQDDENRRAHVAGLEAIGKLLESGKLRPNRVRVLDGGLPAVVKGLQLLQENRVSGQKLVVRVD